jgi:uncharacterized protein YjhX (UPF0386 family)
MAKTEKGKKIVPVKSYNREGLMAGLSLDVVDALRLTKQGALRHRATGELCLFLWYNHTI